MDKYYSKTHEWVKTDGEEAIVGISEYAASDLGDITFVDLPREGTDLICGDKIGTIESVSASSDVSGSISRASSRELSTGVTVSATSVDVHSEMMNEMPSGLSMRPSIPDRKKSGRKHAMMIRVELSIGMRTSFEAS